MPSIGCHADTVIITATLKGVVCRCCVTKSVVDREVSVHSSVPIASVLSSNIEFYRIPAREPPFYKLGSKPSFMFKSPSMCCT